MRLCWTCSRTVEDHEARACKRPHCTAKSDVERNDKKQPVREPRHSVGPYANEYSAPPAWLTMDLA